VICDLAAEVKRSISDLPSFKIAAFTCFAVVSASDLIESITI
jgi:hypothetical protein